MRIYSDITWSMDFFTSTVVLWLMTVTVTHHVSADPLCAFASCPSRSLELNATDPITLPCDNTTLVNTNDTVAGNYSYCDGGNLLVNRSTGYYTFKFNYMDNGATICCYNHDQDICGVCFDLTVYYAPRDQRGLSGPIAHLEQPYTATCDSPGNPPPVCTWIRESLTTVNNGYIYEFDDDGSGVDIEIDDVINITSDVVFSNNGCTIHFPSLERIHFGNYYCFATNYLGRGYASLPTIYFSACQSGTTDVISTGSSNINAVEGSLDETIRLTCIVSPASDLTIIQFSFNNTIYRDGNYYGESYPNGIIVNSTYHNENCSIQSTLTIEQFSQQFVGQYSCAATIFGTNGATGNNLTFNVTLAGQETASDDDAASDDAENRGLIIGIPLAVLIVLILLVVIFIVIRVMSTRRSGLNILKYPPPPYSTEQFQYDAFLSHAGDTEEFAEQVMRRGLKERGYKVKTPGDFMPGHTTDENIIDAYAASRYVVILFSEKYGLNSSELIYAYNKLEMTKTNCLIPVMCGATVPETLQHITYANSDVDDVVSRVALTIGTPLCKA